MLSFDCHDAEPVSVWDQSIGNPVKACSAGRYR